MFLLLLLLLARHTRSQDMVQQLLSKVIRAPHRVGGYDDDDERANIRAHINKESFSSGVTID